MIGWYSSTDCQKSVEAKRSTYSCVPTVLRSILTRRHRTARRDWCLRHLHFRRADWDLILFSDECRFNPSHANGRERVYRRRGERFGDVCDIERDRFGGGSVLAWCGIMGGNKICLIVINGNINAQTYINDAPAVEALPFSQFHGPNVTFMHDNAPSTFCHNNQAVFGDK